MMKYYSLLVLLYSTIFVQAETISDNCLSKSNFKDDECLETTGQGFVCCILEYKDESNNPGRLCNKISEVTIFRKELDEYKEHLETYDKLKDISFKCEKESLSKPESESESESRSKSKYLQLGILSLLILIITL